MTVDRIQVLAGRGMDAHLAYVAMTRQREGATLHASEDEFRDYPTLRQAVGRERLSQGIGDYVPDRAAIEAIRRQLVERDLNLVRSTTAEDRMKTFGQEHVMGDASDGRRERDRAIFRAAGARTKTADERDEAASEVFARIRERRGADRSDGSHARERPDRTHGRSNSRDDGLER